MEGTKKYYWMSYSIQDDKDSSVMYQEACNVEHPFTVIKNVNKEHNRSLKTHYCVLLSWKLISVEDYNLWYNQ